MSRTRTEQGSVTAFVVAFTFVLLVVAGLVIDGGSVLAARRTAINQAEAAARAGSQAVVPDSLRSGGPVVVDPVAAQQRALAYLSATGHSGTVVAEADSVTVTVSFQRPMTILGIAGLGAVTVRGRGTAHAARGVTKEGD